MCGVSDAKTTVNSGTKDTPIHSNTHHVYTYLLSGYGGRFSDDRGGGRGGGGLPPTSSHSRSSRGGRGGASASPLTGIETSASSLTGRIPAIRSILVTTKRNN